MNKKDVEKLLKGREIIDKFRLRNISKEILDEKNVLLNSATNELNKLGFKNMGEFKAFNKHMIAEEIKEFLDIKFLGCEGCPTKQCVKLFGDKACMRKKDKTVDDISALTILHLIYSSKYWSVDELTAPGSFLRRYDDVIICPEGYGYQVTAKKRLRQFDLNWRM